MEFRRRHGGGKWNFVVVTEGIWGEEHSQWMQVATDKTVVCLGRNDENDDRVEVRLTLF